METAPGRLSRILPGHDHVQQHETVKFALASLETTYPGWSLAEIVQEFIALDDRQGEPSR
jgi:hypothetical protein